jgi:hypothetical protein
MFSSDNPVGHGARKRVVADIAVHLCSASPLKRTGMKWQERENSNNPQQAAPRPANMYIKQRDTLAHLLAAKL